MSKTDTATAQELGIVWEHENKSSVAPYPQARARCLRSSKIDSHRKTLSVSSTSPPSPPLSLPLLPASTRYLRSSSPTLHQMPPLGSMAPVTSGQGEAAHGNDNGSRPRSSEEMRTFPSQSVEKKKGASLYFLTDWP